MNPTEESKSPPDGVYTDLNPSDTEASSPGDDEVYLMGATSSTSFVGHLVGHPNRMTEQDCLDFIEYKSPEVFNRLFNRPTSASPQHQALEYYASSGSAVDPGPQLPNHGGIQTTLADKKLFLKSDSGNTNRAVDHCDLVQLQLKRHLIQSVFFGGCLLVLRKSVSLESFSDCTWPFCAYRAAGEAPSQYFLTLVLKKDRVTWHDVPIPINSQSFCLTCVEEIFDTPALPQVLHNAKETATSALDGICEEPNILQRAEDCMPRNRASTSQRVKQIPVVDKVWYCEHSHELSLAIKADHPTIRGQVVHDYLSDIDKTPDDGGSEINANTEASDADFNTIARLPHRPTIIDKDAQDSLWSYLDGPPFPSSSSAPFATPNTAYDAFPFTALAAYIVPQINSDFTGVRSSLSLDDISALRAWKARCMDLTSPVPLAASNAGPSAAAATGSGSGSGSGTTAQAETERMASVVPAKRASAGAEVAKGEELEEGEIVEDDEEEKGKGKDKEHEQRVPKLSEVLAGFW